MHSRNWLLKMCKYLFNHGFKASCLAPHHIQFYGDNWAGLFEAITGYGLGGSSIALFGRVGGGIYTKVRFLITVLLLHNAACICFPFLQ